MRYLIIVISAMLAGVAAGADAPSAIPEGVATYARHIKAVLESSEPSSLEPVFLEGISAAKALERDQLQRLNEPAYRQVQRAMAGFTVTREEVVVAAPVADFFLKLANEKGTPVDRAFFEALKMTYPDGAWPAYYRRQTDYGGCTIFDGRTLTRIYGAWIDFQNSYPGRYRTAVERELVRVGQALASTCVCGGENEFRVELQAFLNAYPAAPTARAVASRLKAVQNRTSEIRFNCRAR